MQVIILEPVDDTALESSNVTEDDYGVWSGATTYNLDDFVIVIGTTHKVYQSVQGSNLNNDPTTDDGTWWVEISATNRWKAFDQVLSDQVENADSITYSLRIPTTESGLPVTGISFFNVEADTVRVQIFDDDDPEVEVYDETLTAVASTSVDDWYEFFYASFDQASELLYLDQPSVQSLPGYSGYRVAITITRTGGTAKLGQFAWGKLFTLGRTVKPGTRITRQDFSVVNTDDFGRQTLISRPSAKIVEFAFTYPTEGGQRLDKLIERTLGTNAVWLTGPSTSQFGTTVYGVIVDQDLEPEGDTSPARLRIQGLT